MLYLTIVLGNQERVNQENMDVRKEIQKLKVDKVRYEDIGNYCKIFSKQNVTPDYRKKEWKVYRVSQKEKQKEKKKVIIASYWTKLVKVIRRFDSTQHPDPLKRFSTKKGVLHIKERTLIIFKLEIGSNLNRFTFVHPDDKDAVINKVFKDPLLGCFRGRDTIWKRISKAYIGISKRDVSRNLASQEIKQICGHEMRREKLEPNEVIIPRNPNDYWQVDITTFKARFPGQRRRNNIATRSLLTIIDIFSRFLWTIPITLKSVAMVESEQSAIEQNIRNLMMREGAPKYLHGDNAFSTTAIAKLCNRFGTKLITGRPYASNDQAAVERVHRSIKEKVSMFMWDSQLKNWERYIQDITFAYNNSMHTGLVIKESEANTPFQVYRNYDNRFSQNQMLQYEIEMEKINDTVQNLSQMNGEAIVNVKQIHFVFETNGSQTDEKQSESNGQKSRKKAIRKESKEQSEQLFIFNDDTKSFRDSGAIFPIGSTVCFTLGGTLYEATIRKIRKENDVVFYEFYLHPLGSESNNNDIDNMNNLEIGTFHDYVHDALTNTIFNEQMRPFEDANNNQTKLCKFYSAKTIGVQYRESEDHGLSNHVGVPFSQNTIAQTLFYLYGNQDPESPAWKFLHSKSEEYKTQFEYLNTTLLNECRMRRITDDMWGAKYPIKVVSTKNHEFFVPFGNTWNADAEEHNNVFNECCLWTLQNNWNESPYEIKRIKIIGRLHDRFDMKEIGGQSYKKQFTRLQVVNEILWAINEFLRRAKKGSETRQKEEEIEKKKKEKRMLLKSIQNVLKSILQQQERLPFNPFIKGENIYNYGPIKNKLFTFNDEKINVEVVNGAGTKNISRNQLCFDTILYFWMNIYDWLEILHDLSDDNNDYRVSPYHKVFFAQVEKEREKFREKSKNEGRNQQGGAIQNALMNEREQVNYNIYLRRMQDRARKVKAEETRINKKYPLKENDIIRIQNKYRTEKAKKDKNEKVTVGRLYHRRGKQGVKSADPDLLDRYNIGAKWSRTLYFVYEVGRVIKFEKNVKIGDQDPPEQFVFIPQKYFHKYNFSDPNEPNLDEKKFKSSICGKEDEKLRKFLQNICEKGYTPAHLINSTTRLRYRAIRITDEFLKERCSKCISKNILNIEKLKTYIVKFRKKHIARFRKENATEEERENAIKCLNKYLPFVYNVKEKANEMGVVTKGDMNFNTKKLRNFYRNNIRAVSTKTITLRTGKKVNDGSEDEDDYGEDEYSEDVE